jgi:hypothetical protein
MLLQTSENVDAYMRSDLCFIPKRVAAAVVNRGVKAEAGEEVKAMEATRATEAMQICPQALPRYGNE